jgi:hypothetical protein
MGGTIKGLYDPVHHRSLQWSAMGQVRVIGNMQYAFSSGKWITSRLSPATLRSLGAGALSLGADPSHLLTMLESQVSQVRQTGSASGPGWTGTEYAFAAPGDHGTVAVDTHGRVRALSAYLIISGRQPPGVRATSERFVITFGDFGVKFTVQTPPASQIWWQPGSH